MKKLFLVLLACTACTDAKMAQYSALGSKGVITCYSGGTVVYKGTSSGKILTENGSDGWYFKEDSTGSLIRTNADCVIRH